MKHVIKKRIANNCRVPMEDTVLGQLAESPIAEYHWIMDIGLVHARNGSSEGINAYIQNAIAEAQSKAQLPMIFVTQHDQSREFEFGENCIVFSCNAKDDQIPMPLYAMNYGLQKKSRTRRFGFLGQLYMHPIRRRLHELYPNEVRRGVLRRWCPDHPVEGPRFVDDLNELVFALSPRGAGLGTLRLYEAMGSGAIPVIIADGYRKPLEWMLDWHGFSVTVPESEIARIPDILGSYSEAVITSMRDAAKHVFEQYFAPAKLCRVVELELARMTRGEREGERSPGKKPWVRPVVTVSG